MVEQRMAGGIDPNSVRKVLRVQAPQAVAWRVFTEQMGRWWPLESYKIGKARAIDAVVEPRVGGRWYELGEDGSSCDWGRVMVWEPHTRLVLSWDVTADWQYDPELKTEIELRFVADGKDATRVELEHRRLDRYGARRDEMRRIFDVEGDWGRLLEGFARVAAAEFGGAPTQ
jgi:activator of Hsp90 ATPase-like protein